MELDIGTIIYIIITIIAIVASVAGKKKKPQVSGSEEYEKDHSESFFERIEGKFGSFIDDAKSSADHLKEEVGMKEEVLETVSQEDVDHTQGVDYKNNSFEPGSAAYSEFEGVYNPNMFENAELIREEAERSTNNSEIIDVIELDESSKPDYFEIVKDFDLGTAVIYSTIINRKEY